jgi:hypothetical protein
MGQKTVLQKGLGNVHAETGVTGQCCHLVSRSDVSGGNEKIANPKSIGIFPGKRYFWKS